jgi:CBS domain-containing protein
MTVKDLMTTEVITVHPGAPLLSAQEKIQRYGVEVLPVVEMGVLVGIITVRDILQQTDLESRIVADHMSMPPIFCREDTPVEQTQELFARSGLHEIPVLNEIGDLVGMLSRSEVDQGLQAA